jgi:hypothetical protein
MLLVPLLLVMSVVFHTSFLTTTSISQTADNLGVVVIVVVSVDDF